MALNVQQDCVDQPEEKAPLTRLESLITNPRTVGRPEMEAIMDKYASEELLLMAACLRYFQLSRGCSPQCDFCCMNTAKGPTDNITPHGADAFLSRKATWPAHQDKREMTMGSAMLNSWLVRGGTQASNNRCLYWKSDGLDNRWYEEICELVRTHTLLKPFLSTAFPDVEGVGDRVLALVDRGYRARISVTKENTARLVAEGFLKEEAPSRMSRWTSFGSDRSPGKGTYEVLIQREGLEYRSRVEGQKIRVGQNGDFEAKEGQVEEGGVARIGRIHSKDNLSAVQFDTGVLLDTQGFYNVVYVRGYDHIGGRGAQYLKTRINPDFSSSTYINDLVEGIVPLEQSDIRKILQDGVVEKGISYPGTEGLMVVYEAPVVTIIPEIMHFTENEDGSVTESIRKVDVHTLIQDKELIVSKLVARTEVVTRDEGGTILFHDTEDSNIIVRNPHARRCIEDDVKRRLGEEEPFEPINLQQRIAKLIRKV